MYDIFESFAELLNMRKQEGYSPYKALKYAVDEMRIYCDSEMYYYGYDLGLKSRVFGFVSNGNEIKTYFNVTDKRSTSPVLIGDWHGFKNEVIDHLRHINLIDALNKDLVDLINKTYAYNAKNYIVEYLVCSIKQIMKSPNKTMHYYIMRLKNLLHQFNVDDIEIKEINSKNEYSVIISCNKCYKVNCTMVSGKYKISISAY